MRSLLPTLLALIMCFSSSVVAQTVVKLDPSAARAPISKYIYGQFIEHLGKCIYGGLWAEMIQDRKFFYPVTDEFKPFSTREDPNWGTGPFLVLTGSPWKVIGLPGLVKMETEAPFVGKQSVSIIIPGSGAETGISQDGLKLVAGKKYVGRIVLAASGEEVAPVIVQLALPDGKVLTRQINDLSTDYKTFPLEFTSPIAAENARIEIISNAGPGTVFIGAISLMPADNIHGFRADTVALLKELNSPIYRWPGGNFVSGYDWRDGIGTDPDKRAPKSNPAWAEIEHNDVGIHEFMVLMQLINAEPFVALNMGLGSVEEAAKEVEYVVGSPDTEMGKLRAANGHAEPWTVKYWAVGNEMYGQWQLGVMPQSEFIKKHNDAAAAIRRIDPNAKLIAVGSVGDWSRNMLAGSADFMNLLSEHFYCKLKPDPIEHAKQLRGEVKRIADAHRAYRKEIPQLAGKNIPIAMDEWNYWYGNYVFGELGVRYRHKDGLGVALGLHEYFRNSDLYFMANYAQTVNVLGAIKANGSAAALETTGLVLKLYRNEFGTIPIAIRDQPADLDISAAWTEDRQTLTVAAVNLTNETKQFKVDFPGVSLASAAKLWTIASSDMDAFNDPSNPPVVQIESSETNIAGNTLRIPAQAVVLYRIAKQ